MKVILYMAITANGMIARENDDSDFLSGEEWKAYLQMAKNAGNCIMGRKTYEVCVADELTFPVPNALNIIMTSRAINNKWPQKVIFTNKSPKQVLAFLRTKGFQSAFLAGGAKLNTSFIKQKLVDEVYLDVVPLILGRGVKLFEDFPFETKLKLVGTRKFSGGFIQLHYKVIK